MKNLAVILLCVFVTGCALNGQEQTGVVLKSDKYYEAKLAVLAQAKVPETLIFGDIFYNDEFMATCGYLGNVGDSDVVDQFIYTAEDKRVTLKSNYSEAQYDLFQSSVRFCT